MIDHATMDHTAGVIPLSDALPPVMLLLGGVPVLTGLVIAAARYVAVGTI